jgi:hypothetical protein
MSHDVFEELMAAEVPPPPAEMVRDVHERLNRSLLVAQLMEFVLWAAPYAAVQLGQAVAALAVGTITGKYEVDGPPTSAGSKPC